MSAPGEGASTLERWTCEDCGVTASYEAGRTGPAPEAWVRQERGWLCLQCRREEVAAGAVSDTREGRRVERRQALAEFELMRDPGASDGMIASRAKTSSAVVKPIRAQLREAGKLPEAG